MRVGIRAAVLLAVSGVAGCGPGRGDLMMTAPPPPGWAAGIAAERAAKDREFRTDPETALLPADVPTFKGLDYWPLDPSYRFAGPIHRDETPRRFTILSTTGKPRPCETYGWIAFELGGKRCRLRIYRLLDTGPEPGVEGLFLPFTDATTGRETYPAGRYVDLSASEGGPYVVDFNRAYNPSCAYGAPERFACPVTPAENRLAVRVEAGERGYKRRGEAGS
jgi:uncharacterized protein (DUF1684 family)